MKEPSLSIRIDVKTDTENGIYFVRNEFEPIPNFLNMFLPVDIQYVTSNTFTPGEKVKIIREYTSHIYRIKRDVIAAGIAETKKRWARTEKKYYKFIDQVFDGHPWPKGTYTGTASIFSVYPRDIEKKTFFLPYEKNHLDPAGVIAHEMLHFIFFDFIKKKYGLAEGSKIKDRNDIHVWQVSETFNTVIEGWKPYKELFGDYSRVYPGCEEMHKKMKRQWRQKQDLSWLLDKWLEKGSLIGT